MFTGIDEKSIESEDIVGMAPASAGE